MRAALRPALFGLALITCWAVLLLLVAGVRWGMPLSGQQRVFHGNRFHAAFGTAQIQGQDLHVTAAGEDYSALQVTQLPELDAAHFSLLSYRFDDFPRTLELSFVFRRSDSQDVETISVPRPRRGHFTTVDLSTFDGWRGRIVEMGFAQFPVAQLAPPAGAFRPFVFEQASLHAASWLGQLKALGSAWAARSPWQLVSISALGPSEIGDSTPHVMRPPLVFALALACALVLARAILRWRGRRLALLAVAGLGVAWIALDLIWLRELDYKRRADRDIWAGLSLEQRQQHVADHDLAAAAAQLKELLRDEPPARHILLSTLSPYTSIRFVYHAAPLNISIAAALPVSFDDGPPQAGTIIVRYDMPGAAQGSTLAFGGQVLRVQVLDDGEHLKVYRVLGRKP